MQKFKDSENDFFVTELRSWDNVYTLSIDMMLYESPGGNQVDGLPPVPVEE